MLDISLADNFPARAAGASSTRELFQPPPAIRSLKAVEGNWGMITEALETVGLTPQLIRESRLQGADVQRLLQVRAFATGQHVRALMTYVFICTARALSTEAVLAVATDGCLPPPAAAGFLRVHIRIFLATGGDVHVCAQSSRTVRTCVVYLCNVAGEGRCRQACVTWAAFGTRAGLVRIAAGVRAGILPIKLPLLCTGEFGYKPAMAAIERRHQEELARMRAQAQAAEESSNARDAHQRAELEIERLRAASALGELETVREQLEGAISDAERARERLAEQQRLLTREEGARLASDASAEGLKERLSAVKAQLICIPSLRQQIAEAEAEVKVARAETLAKDEPIRELGAMLARATGETLLLQREIANIEPQLVVNRGSEIELAAEVANLQKETVVYRGSLERSQAEVGRLETLAARTAVELKSAAAAYQLELAQLTGERNDAQERANSSREEVDSLKWILENKVSSLESAEERCKQLQLVQDKLTEETAEQKVEILELITHNKQLASERDRALDGKKRAEERYDGQEASLRYLQGKVDGYQAELREEVGKVQRKVDALSIDLTAKNISAKTLESELEWCKCTIQELETQVKELNVQASNFPEREAALVAEYESQLLHERRLNASAQDEEKMTEAKYKKLAAEQHELQLEVLNLLTSLKLNGLHENVMQMIHATEEQEVMITHLAPFRDSFFDVDVASAALLDLVEPMQEARDAAFEMYMLELDQSRAFEHADECLERLCDQLGALAAQAAAQLAPLADEAAEAISLLQGLRNRVASLESKLAASKIEAKELEAHNKTLEKEHTTALKRAEEKAFAGSTELRRKYRAQLKQLIALKEKLDDAEYELSQWAVGAIRTSNISQWRKEQELKKAKNAPVSNLSGLGSEVSEDSFDNDFHDDYRQAGGASRTQRRHSFVRDSASIAAAAVTERKRAKDGNNSPAVLSGNVAANESLRNSKMLWNREAGLHTVGASHGTSTSMGSIRPLSRLSERGNKPTPVDASLVEASVVGDQVHTMIETNAGYRILGVDTAAETISEEMAENRISEAVNTGVAAATDGAAVSGGEIGAADIEGEIEANSTVSREMKTEVEAECMSLPQAEGIAGRGGT
jgi:chromosome segregation ATPase